MVTERPIIFSGPMVRAILAGAKTQTRRVVRMPNEIPHSDVALTRMQPDYPDGTRPVWDVDGDPNAFSSPPYCNVGDRLWVRESFRRAPGVLGYGNTPESFEFKASRLKSDDVGTGFPARPWSPSIHMPRWVSRITLEVTNVRVERLQEITSDDAIAEGIEPAGTGDASEEWAFNRAAFALLWDSVAKAGNHWTADPWVWVIEFRVMGSGA